MTRTAISPGARVGCLILGFAMLVSVGLVQVARRRAVVEVGYDVGQSMSEYCSFVSARSVGSASCSVSST